MPTAVNESPVRGKRIIPAFLDYLAVHEPRRPFLALPVTSDPQGGFEDVSCKAFAEMVDRCA